MSFKLTYKDSEKYGFKYTSPIGHGYNYYDTLKYSFQVSRSLALTSTLYELIKRNLVMMFANYTGLSNLPNYQLYYVPWVPFASLQGGIVYFSDGTTMNVDPSNITIQAIAGGLIYTIGFTLPETKTVVGVGVIINIMSANQFVSGIKGFSVQLPPGSYSIQIQEYMIEQGISGTLLDPIVGELVSLLQTCLTDPSSCPQTYSTCGSNNICTSKCLFPAVWLSGIYAYGSDNTGSTYMIDLLSSFNGPTPNVEINYTGSISMPNPLSVYYEIDLNFNNLQNYNPQAKYYCMYTTFWYVCTVGRLGYTNAQPNNVNFNNKLCITQGSPMRIIIQWLLYPPTI